jgi:hypothetical protein
VLAVLRNLIIFLTPVDIDHMVFISKASTGSLSKND